MTQMNDRDPRTYAILGCAMEVHKVLGCGFLESAYQEALALEFQSQGVPYRREVSLPLFYEGQALDTVWKADFIAYDAVLIELKVAAQLSEAHDAQILHYLKVSGFPVGLLLNLGRTRLEYKRFIHSASSASSATSAVERSG